jgi:putative glycosyltransferase (TIGR04372 family)
MPTNDTVPSISPTPSSVDSDNFPRADPTHFERAFNVRTMQSLVGLIKPHLEADKRKLVYIFPASDAIGHVMGEMFALWALHGERYDELLVVIADRSLEPMPEGPTRVVEQYVTFVETQDPDVLLLGHFTAPTQEFGVFDVIFASAAGLCDAFYPMMADQGIGRPFKIPADMTVAGEDFLRDLGWRPGERIVVFHARERSNLANLGYHSFRTVDVANYRPAIAHLLDAGVWVFRLGDSSSTPIHHDNNRFIDLPGLENYADWMDVFLVSRAYFSLNCSSGPVSYCHPLKIPSLVVNNVAQSFNLFVATSDYLLMFKHYREVATGRHLSYAEILERDLSDFSETRRFDAAGIILEENSQEEILEAVIEMVARLEGRHIEISANQERFRQLGADYDHERQRRVAEGTAPPEMMEAPHYCFSIPGMNIVDTFCDRHPSFLD